MKQYWFIFRGRHQSTSIEWSLHPYSWTQPVGVILIYQDFILTTFSFWKKKSDYPDFYSKLYALLDDQVLHVKYRSRFFRLLDLFLSSSYIPSYLVAAFIKRLARLSLNATPGGLVIVIPLIYNLFKRHPASLVLIHRDESITGMHQIIWCQYMLSYISIKKKSINLFRIRWSVRHEWNGSFKM